ncbi:aminoglycoside phosphotransferase family protein [uncultured Litoreibacter sp.]|uniref:aminoglycoside phosphotransferase family protein n=1 Tax=uncultured Litoreibacter sp. TaxID=1392394 RepID=UPI00262333D0|nr:aminoglycoside phosphotransferase family protein [uncultured Litoreibacter sp.]
MNVPPRVSSRILKSFQVSVPTFIDETSIATVWRVICRSGEHAALKIYKNQNMGNERCGFAFLQALKGRGCADVYIQSDNAMLLEWLDGPSLGDLARSGRDEEADNELVKLAVKIHQGTGPISGDFPALADWFGSLFQLKLSADCDPELRHTIQQSKILARNLLSTSYDLRPLHGDLHHDNVRLGAHGYRAFDAKGVLGERTYELANAFRNPRGMKDLIRAPARIRMRASNWSAKFGVNERRLLQWAAVKCALSIAWRNTELSDDDEADLLVLLMQELKEN